MLEFSHDPTGEHLKLFIQNWCSFYTTQFAYIVHIFATPHLII